MASEGSFQGQHPSVNTGRVRGNHTRHNQRPRGLDSALHDGAHEPGRLRSWAVRGAASLRGGAGRSRGSPMVATARARSADDAPDPHREKSPTAPAQTSPEPPPCPDVQRRMTVRIILPPHPNPTAKTSGTELKHFYFYFFYSQKTLATCTFPVSLEIILCNFRT